MRPPHAAIVATVITLANAAATAVILLRLYPLIPVWYREIVLSHAFNAIVAKIKDRCWLEVNDEPDPLDGVSYIVLASACTL
jgi:hypothetical protein